MKTFQSEALTLRTYPYSESHKIAVFLTRKFGKVRGIAYGAQKPHSRFGSSLEPLTHLRLTFSRKEHQELAVIQSCEIIQAFPAYQLSLERNVYYGYFVELLTEFAKEQEEGEMFFRLALAVLDASQDVPVPLLARYFELWLLKLEGILPRLETRLPPELASKAEAIMKVHPSQLEDVQLASAESRRLGTLLGELIEYHLEKKLKARELLDRLV